MNQAPERKHWRDVDLGRSFRADQTAWKNGFYKRPF
jgi:hypothetical protein